MMGQMTKHYRGGILREEDIKKMDEDRKRPNPEQEETVSFWDFVKQKLKEEENADLQM